ncbi:cobalamin-independent methionine synthase II family protein [Cellulomonas denverensis]|uniref:Cobalamin-independent methionine synthase II family protein n=1 Tax=Cellulomonas denverensis TaxID=264297 RepID=A0A7X6KSB1_9CELL|nr:cobalamin-independent methionine synthase II family protein [Cellulomonas denverensis]NKY21357.1 cobalamin-independent methionine synthase II family protein [Cellulomonas denverensis]GIG27321.1 methionine synthase [Cellulomonas denverensis]
MKRSTDRILTTHAGSLPRLDDLTAAHAAVEAGEQAEVATVLTDAVGETVRLQQEIGISVPGDGELGKASSSPIDYGAWWSYCFQRLGGLELREGYGWITRDVQSSPGDVRTTGFGHRRDRARFEQAYDDPTSGIFAGGAPKPYPTAVAPVTYTGQDAIAADIRNLKAALDAHGYTEGFLTSIAPGSVVRIDNDFYDTDEEFVWACADAMREEYRAIIDAGLILQIDDPSLAENWDQITPEPSVADYQAFSRVRVEALNHALRGLPEDRIRYHLCWGSWHGPHTTDLPMRDIVGLMLEVNAGAYSFEAGNVRHEHEWKVWQDVTLPDGKVILPGVVSHATNVVEHPELVADRIERFAGLVGRENVIASTDCGLGGRIHPQIAWAKLRTLTEGAELATRRLWA